MYVVLIIFFLSFGLCVARACRGLGLYLHISKEELEACFNDRTEYAAETCGESELDVCFYLLGEEVGRDIDLCALKSVEV